MAVQIISITLEELINAQGSLRTIAGLKLKPKLAYTLGVVILRRQIDTHLKDFTEFRNQKVEEVGVINPATQKKHIPQEPNPEKPEEIAATKAFEEIMDDTLKAEIHLEIQPIAIEELVLNNVTLSPADMMNTWFLWEDEPAEEKPKRRRRSKKSDGTDE